MLRTRSFIAFLCVALALCVIGLRGARSQSNSLWRITSTREEGVNLNPSLSGDGRRVAFESSEDLAHVGGTGGFRAIRATLTSTGVSFIQMGMTRAPAPAISQDGSRIAFASKDNPFGTNADGNSEIFFYNGSTLKQITNTSPGDISQRLRNGNFQPSMSDDGRYIAFASNRDLASLNSDANLEVFIYDTVSQTFTQLTNTAGTIGATDAKISGDGSRIAYIRDSNTIGGAARDLLLQQRTGGAPRVIAAGVLNLSMTYGRAISDDGLRVVFSAPRESDAALQVHLFDGRNNSTTRTITSLPLPGEKGDVPLHPTISGDGTRIAFATRRTLGGGNSDESVELYTFHIPTGQFSRLTSAPSSANADVVSSLNDDGSIVAFSFPRVLSGSVSSSSFANNSEIYVTGTTGGTPVGNELTVLNGASFGNEPSSTKAVAPDSIAVALGSSLATTTLQAHPSPDGTFPLSLGGTTVTVNGRAAQIFSVSPDQVKFLVPAATEIGTAQVVVTNSDNLQLRTTVPVLVAAPGVFTRSGDGLGEGVIVDAATHQPGPFDPTNGMLHLIVFATGVRNASSVSVSIGGRAVTVESVTPSSDMPGQDEIRILVPADLRGAGTVDLVVRADDRASNPVTVTFTGQAPRSVIIINEVLADPPDGAAGDANHDGVRDSSDDEFVELVNSSTRDIDISGYQLLTHSTDATDENLRHTFAPGTIFPAGTAIVVFGGGNPRPNDPIFGGAQVFTATDEDGSSSRLSLSNSGAVITLREPSGVLVTTFSYGGSTGLSGSRGQSLTRSPDITGGFTLHQTAAGSGGRSFSPGTRVNGTPFVATPAIARIQITPASANIGTGAHQQFTAHAFNSNGQELSGVIFKWQSSNPSVATIDQNGLATALKPGSTQIRASARGVQSAPATLTVFFQEQVLTSIEVTPASASIPPGGQQQFTARALDQNGNEIVGVTFTWSSSNTNVATIDQNGLATALALGTTTIKASAQGVTGSATLRVVTPVLVFNEVLADPPGSEETDLIGDANHDGVRASNQDEFVELVNASNARLDISGWSVYTRPLDETKETLRHTFADGTTLDSRAAIVIFGGGAFDPNNPAFACAQVVKASSGRLSLSNSGRAIIVRNASGALFAQFTYGSGTGLNGGKDQSLTRSPDITGQFVLHTQAAGAEGRLFSPGTRVDGSPFGSCPGRLTSVIITPDPATVIVGRTTQMTAQALDQFGRPMPGVTITFASSNTSIATIESVNANPAAGSAVATVKGRKIGTTRITATATDGTTTVTGNATLNVTPVPPRVTRIEVTPEKATINRGTTQQFTAHAFNQNAPVSGVTFTWTSSNTDVATVDSKGLARGVGIGTVTITATAPDGEGGTVSDQATLTVLVPLVINELLADVPQDDPATAEIEGDANRDGVRDSGDDEFIELFNNSSDPVDISGVVISDSTHNRFTFPENTTLAAGRAVVVFGGGTPPTTDPAFGGALILKASSLGLNDTGDTVTVKLPVADRDVSIAVLTYGTGGTAPAPKDQSLTRSPDAAVGTTGGKFVAHTTATNAAGRVFSPGTRADGTPFGSPPITRIQVIPSSATIEIGETKTFTARAFSNAKGAEVEVQNVSFIWDSSDPSKATVAPTTGKSTTATAITGGTVVIRARAGGQQGTATLNIKFPPVSRIVITPSSARIPVGGTQQFTARAFDQNNKEIVGITFTWSSSNTKVATIDQNGLATGVGVGTTTITASAGGKSDTATLNVVARTVTINEVLADPPEGAAGDANRDGVRDSGDDEFVELVNALSTSVNISGWTIRTRSATSSSETTRHTFAANTTLPAGRAIVVFGGGTPNPADPAFGGSQVVTASTGRLSLTNSGLTIIVRDATGNLVTQFTYGGTTGLNGGSNQSLTRSPDITGDFVLHTQAAGSDGRVFSPGTRVDGTPFGSPPITRIQVIPSSATVNIGQMKTFTARAFSNANGPEVEVQNVSFIWDSSDPSKATVSPTTGRSTTATAMTGGTVTIRARAGGQQGTATLNINFPPISRVEVTPASATIPVGGTQQFTARAFDQNNQEIAGVTFTWTSSNTNVATIDQNGLATGVGVGTTTITASAGGKSDTAQLNVVARTVTINEVLADPPDGLAGDANRDGVRDSSDDEFVELVNALNTSVNISGWTIRTHSTTSSNETIQHTFAGGTTLPAGRAIVVFGGGTPNPTDPAFGGAQIVTASSGNLSLTNSGLTIVVRDASGNLVAQFTYGANGGSNQSLTRSPDITGDFVLHTQAAGSDGRVFSPGTRVDGTPFGSPPITRIEIMPPSAAVNIGETQTFTARAFSNTNGPEVEVQNVSFIWDSSDPSKATVSPTTGRSTTATAHSGGSVMIRARAGGQGAAATLNINFPPISRVEVTPESATIPVGGTQQFTARAFDQNNQEIAGVTFTWTSSKTNVATIDQNGLATGVGVGTTTITASAGGKSDTATLEVVARTVTINEVLADPPDGLAGDANRDGVRDSSDDEFVELVNALNTSVNISGWTIRTRSLTGTTETTRHTFAASTTLPAGDAIVVFGGGTPDPNDPAFGGSQIVTASTGRLSLTNSGLTVIVRDASGNLVTQLTYGGSTGLNGDANQSLTRSPDITGDFVLHTQAAGANGRRFSPGRKADGSLFVPRTGHLTSVDISPDSASVVEGQTTQFTAQAFDQYGQPMTGINITFASSNTNVATVESVTTNPNTGVATATVRGQSVGTAQITATASDGTTTVMSDPATLNVTAAPPQVDHVEVSPSTATINRGQTQQFTATAFNANNQPVSGVTFTWTSSNEAVATVDQNGLATGVGIGTTTITATAPDGQGGTVSGEATLNVQVPLVINEILADPPGNVATDIVGDANRDGTRSSDDDEFIELLNNSNAPVDISGVIITDATSTHFTFKPNTILAAGRAVVIFGGGTPPPNEPEFGGALVLTVADSATASSSLNLANSGDNVTLKLSVSGTDVVIDSHTYGSEGGQDESLTRSPDAEVGSAGGSFVKHKTPANSDGRAFSPGTRLDGTPFGSPPITRIEVMPATAAINIGETQQFTAKAFSNTGGSEVEVPNVSFVWKSSDTSKATVSPRPGEETTATAHAEGTVTISALAGGEEGTAQLTINPPPPTLSINDVTLNEGDGGTTTFTFTVSLSSPAQAGGVTFDIATADGTAHDDNPASEDDDYEPKSLTNQTIPEGSQTFTFNVTVNGDMTNEPDETFFVNVTNVTGANLSDGQGQGTILNDDSPQLSINDVTMAEGDTGATIFTFTVHSSRPAPAGGITFDIATADGTAHDDNPASEDDDYEPKSLTNQTIPEGDQDYTFQVTVNGDTFVETDETFTVNLSNVMNAGVSDGQGVGTITNDDDAVVVISQVYGGGGNAGATYTHDFIEVFNRGTTTVDLAGWSVQYNSATGTGNWSVTPLCPTGPCLLEPGQYFLVQEAVGAGGTTPLPDPDATGTIPMTAGTGKVALVNKTMALTGACPSADASIVDLVGYGSNASTANFCFEGAGPAPAPNPPNTTADFRKGGGCVDTNNNQADFFIHAPVPRNTDSPLNTCNAGQTTDITINDVTVTEGNGGTVAATFTVSLSAPSASTVTVDYATADGTAHAPADYTAIPTTQLVFNPGDMSKTVNVQVKGDTIDEADETFFVNLTNASNAAILDNQGKGTITDDDAPAVLTVSDFSASEGDSGTSDFTFTVHLSAPAPASGVTFDIATQDDSATDADNDYEPKSLTNQTIPSGEDTYTFKVMVNGDTVDEPNETFFVNVTNVTGATLTGGDGQGVGTIQNDDSPPIVIDHIAVTPTSATITIGGTQQFTARAFDASNNEITGVTFTWESSNTSVATIDSNGLATGVSAGTTQITASSGGVTSNAATLTVARKPNASNELIINEIFANPGAGGDANRDGTPGASNDMRDEFVEILNPTAVPLDLGGLNLYDSTNTSAKHTFPVNTILQPGKAIVVFGGETGTAASSNIPGIPAGVSSKTTTAPNASFGGAIVQVASSYTFGSLTSALGLNNNGTSTVPADRVRIVNGTIAPDGTVTGTMIADIGYFNSTASTIADKSLTRLDGEAGGNRDLRSTGTPNDLHPVINNASSPYNGKAYSPGFRRDGNPFP